LTTSATILFSVGVGIACRLGLALVASATVLLTIFSLFVSYKIFPTYDYGGNTLRVVGRIDKSLFSRGCNASDGMMDTAYLAARNVLDLIPSVGWLPLGCPERSRFYGRVRTGKLTIKTDRPVTPNVDGDASPPTTELTLKVVPGAVRMVLI
jgi:hypothetical protein